MSIAPAHEEQIRAKPHPHCTLCGNPGEFIHLQLSDCLFGAPGQWNLKRCSDSKCELVWLDPMPIEEDIGKAYATYYTHSAPPQNTTRQLGWLRRAYRLLKLSYLADKYGYETGIRRQLIGKLGKLLYLFPMRRRGVDGFVRSLRW